MQKTFFKKIKKTSKKVLTNPIRSAIIVKLAREQRTLKTIQKQETQTTVNKLELLLLDKEELNGLNIRV